MTDHPVRFVQISDIHHFGDLENSLLGVPTHKSFMALLDLLKKDTKQRDFILLTGDLSQDGSESSYLHVAEAIKQFTVPVYWVAGNHDNSEVMTHVYPRENINNLKHIILEHWHIILLDSHIHKHVEGHLDPVQLRFLQNCLDMYPEHHALVVFHHHPVSVGSAWLDKIGVNNPDDFWNRLSGHPKLKHILFGHVHQQVEGEKNGIKYFSTPATCIQFKKHSDQFALDELGPAYRWIELYPDGKLKTEVCRLNEYIGVFDNSAKGY